MKRFLSYSITFLFSINWLFSQTQEDKDFNRAFLQIYMHTASEDMDKAIAAADSLYRHAGSDVHRIRSLMLISDMYHRLANRDSSIHYAIDAERIAERTGNYTWQARVCGVLSTQHRETGLFTEGKRYLEKGLKVIEKVDNPELVKQFKGQCFQERGFYELEEKQYREAIAHFKQAAPFFAGLADSVVRYFALAQNGERLGLCYLELGAIDSAAAHYERALAMERKASGADTPVKGFIYNGLGRISLLKEDYKQADSCFQKALAIAETTEFPNLKIGVYKSLSLFHQATGNEDGYREYNGKYLKEIQDNTIKHKRYADRILARIQHDLVKITASNRALGVTASAFIVIAGMGMGIYIRNQRRNRRRYKAIIKTLKRGNVLAAEQPGAHVVIDREKEIMPESTKQELLKKLERFESSQQFTDRNISIAVLAGKMKTNTKYLSYIINNYRNKDFNSYINELRINYIVAKIDEDNRYLNYKISYLAEECGFATHSQFTTVFKNITGLSPSIFMAYLKKDGHTVDSVLEERAVG